MNEHIHYAFAPGQPATDAKTGCGKTISTWGKKIYSFSPEEVNCPACIDWMDKMLNKCECGKVAVYAACRECSIKWLEENCCRRCNMPYKWCHCFSAKVEHRPGNKVKKCYECGGACEDFVCKACMAEWGEKHPCNDCKKPRHLCQCPCQIKVRAGAENKRASWVDKLKKWMGL